MFFNNKLNDEERETIREYEEYQQRQEKIRLAQNTGGFLYKFISYSLVYFSTYAVLAYGLLHFLKVGFGTSVIVSMILSFFVFKIRYVKSYPFKTFFTLVFLMFIEAVILNRTIEFFQ